MWHSKTVRTSPVGQVDDQWLDHTRIDPETAKNAGRKSDAHTGGGYADIALVREMPELMAGDGKARPTNKARPTSAAPIWSWPTTRNGGGGGGFLDRVSRECLLA
jgi:hypothetical protein